MLRTEAGTTIEQRGTEITIRLPHVLDTTADPNTGVPTIHRINNFTEGELMSLLGMADEIYKLKLYSINEEN